MVLSGKSFGPESTSEELEALRNRVYMHSEDILVFKDIPESTRFSEKVLFDQADKLVGAHESFVMIVDLSDSTRPNAEVRHYIQDRIKSMTRLRHISVIIPNKNLLLEMAAKFIMRGMGLKSYAICKTLEEALERIRNV